MHSTWIVTDTVHAFRTDRQPDATGAANDVNIGVPGFSRPAVVSSFIIPVPSYKIFHRYKSKCPWQ